MRYAHDYLTPRQRVMSGAFALGMHALLLLLLIFGVTWQRKTEPQVNIVDLYANLPARPKPVEPPARPEPKPEPRVEPRPVVPPKAEVKPAPKPEVVKPDIALKDKAEKARRQIEEKQKEARKREEDAKAVAARQQQAKEAADAQRRIKEQEDAQRKVLEQSASARKSQMDKYENAIRERIRRFIVLPPNIQGNPEAEFDVIQLPGGEVLGAKLKRSSGNTAYDNAVERAILKAQPLPLPPEPSLFRRELNLVFRPQD
jgi:colicin import membrane protein